MDKTENEQKKAYLKSYQQARITVKTIDEELRLLELDEICPSIRYSDMPRGSGGESDLSDYAADRDELFRDLISARWQRIKRHRDISQCIEQMEDETEKNLLRLRYLLLKTWEEAAKEIGYSRKQADRIHSSALNNFKILKDDTV